MDDYEKLLEKAYTTVKVVGTGGKRFEVPKVEGHVSGKNTFITNFAVIVSYLRKDAAHVAKFLQKELAVSGQLRGSRLILKTKLSSGRVNEKIEKYAKEFIICPVCGKPDTEIVSEKSVKYKHCLACGAKSPVKYHL
ncbi:MAG: translation initiation factor IF-2 subunit beta [Nanoarchaeota archaeon]|nr:translation initiation factor IF-2 subunit beta [Nanoarchaeota archaeon]MBU1102966.1 translation initiation factor IF-2 subunit beta [Nanoarchaeota archaeon]